MANTPEEIINAGFEALVDAVQGTRDVGHPQKGKYGRRPPKNAPALMLGRFLTGVIPTHPKSLDYDAKLSNWQMLGNDVAGDCVPVTWANERREVTALLGGKEVYPTQAQVWQMYQTQNPTFSPNGTANTNGPGSSADQGMDIQTFLEYLQSTGGADGVKAVAFAKVDFTNLEEVKAAIAIFGEIWIGINVQEVNPQEFAQNQPWNYVAGSPVEGGHSIKGGGYLGTSASDMRFITWAKETSFTDSFWAHNVEECWVVIWPEHLGTAEFMAGIDLPTLAADYLELTGDTLTIPTPTPVPAPTPAPNPVDPPPAPGSGILAAMADQGDTPMTGEVYFKGETGTYMSLTRGGKGLYCYSPVDSSVGFIPFEKIYT